MVVKLEDKTVLRNDPERFAGRIALVTGAGSGIGRAAALAFGRQGATVALVGRRVPELEAVAREIAETGGTATVAPADITDERAVEKMIGAVVEQFGRLDIAFNNAGVAAYKPIEGMTTDDGARGISISFPVTTMVPNPAPPSSSFLAPEPTLDVWSHHRLEQQ